MDLSQHRTTELQATLISTLSYAEKWEARWNAATTAQEKMDAFLSWDAMYRAKEEIKAELRRRGEPANDWTDPKPPRRLP
jgi:hypothetical protein